MTGAASPKVTIGHDQHGRLARALRPARVVAALQPQLCPQCLLEHAGAVFRVGVLDMFSVADGDHPLTCQTLRERPEEVAGAMSGLVWLVGHHLTAPMEGSMDDLTDDTLMGLAEFRKLLHLSPSGERRMRAEQQDWPPHMMVGRKVFYFRDGVKSFLVRRLGVPVGRRPAVGAAAGDRATQAPAFTDEQRKWLQAVFVRPPEDADHPFRPVDLDAPRNQGEGHE